MWAAPRPSRSISLVALWLGLAFVACGRTGLDEPVSVTGSAGTRGGAGNQGTAGVLGTAGTFGTAGVIGTAGVFGTAGVIGTAGVFGTAGVIGTAGVFGTAGVTGTAGVFGTAGVTGAAGVFGTAGVTGTAGTGACADGMRECDGANSARFCAGDEWGPSFSCPLGCFDGVCAECVPGTATCVSAVVSQVCNASGILMAPTICPGACTNGACAGCTEGDTRCASDAVQQTCKGGDWTVAVDCPFVCVDKACGQNPKKVFVSSMTFVGGSLGGIDGANSLCRELADLAVVPGTFFAWISDSMGSPALRFAKDGGPYVLVDGTVVANNWDDLTSGTLRHPINLTELGGAAPPADGGCPGANAWTDTNIDGTLLAADFSCGDWSDEMSTFADVGAANATTGWSDACIPIGSPEQTCGSSAALFCFEQ